MKIARLVLVLATLALFAGCAHVSSSTKDPVLVPNGTNAPIVALRQTKMSAYTLFDSQSQLAKFQNRGQLTSSNEWASGTSIGSLQQASSTSNAAPLMQAIAAGATEGAIRGAAAAAKP